MAGIGLYPMSMIFLSLLLLIGIGAIFFNLNAEGLGTTPVLDCTNATQFLPTCHSIMPTGCQANAQFCQLNSTKFVFYNQQSPFGELLSGNIFGLFDGINSNGNSNHGPFDATGGGVYYTGSCYAPITDSPSRRLIVNWVSCTATTPDNVNETISQAFNVTNWNPNQSHITTKVPFVDWNLKQYLPFFPPSSGCAYIAQVNYTSSTGYTWYGCDLAVGPGGNPNNPTFSVVVSIPNNVLYGINTGLQHFNVYVQPQSWDAEWCSHSFNNPSVSIYLRYQSQQCNNLENNVNHVPTGFNWGLLTPLVTFLIGVALFFIGTGINTYG